MRKQHKVVDPNQQTLQFAAPEWGTPWLLQLSESLKRFYDSSSRLAIGQVYWVRQGPVLEYTQTPYRGQMLAWTAYDELGKP